MYVVLYITILFYLAATTLLPNVQIRISARSSKSKPSLSSKKDSSVGDVEAGLLGSDLVSHFSTPNHRSNLFT